MSTVLATDGSCAVLAGWAGPQLLHAALAGAPSSSSWPASYLFVIAVTAQARG